MSVTSFEFINFILFYYNYCITSKIEKHSNYYTEFQIQDPPADT